MRQLLQSLPLHHGLPALLLFAAISATAADVRTVRIVYFGADGAGRQGAEQGIHEANAQGRFLGLEYVLVNARDQADALALNGIAIVADLSPLRLVKLAESADAPVFNISAEDDELREACRPNLLHTIPSLAMRDDAIAQWQRKNPGAGASAQAWHRDFRKYAAAQLNKRYQERFGTPMDDTAWAGWAAVKLVSDTLARSGDMNGAELTVSLHEDLAFDGQKGIDMSFRNTGQLRQPMLLIDNDTIVGEAPVRGVVNPGNLDSLGLADCHK